MLHQQMRKKWRRKSKIGKRERKNKKERIKQNKRNFILKLSKNYPNIINQENNGL